MDYSHLPEEFRFSHNFCFFLHDQLVETLKAGEKAGIFDVQLAGEHPIPETLEGEHLFEWLTNTSRKPEFVSRLPSLPQKAQAKRARGHKPLLQRRMSGHRSISRTARRRRRRDSIAVVRRYRRAIARCLR